MKKGAIAVVAITVAVAVLPVVWGVVWAADEADESVPQFEFVLSGGDTLQDNRDSHLFKYDVTLFNR